MQSTPINKVPGKALASRGHLVIKCTIAPRRESMQGWSSGSNQPSTSSSTTSRDTDLHLTGMAVEEHAMRVCIEQHKRYPNGLPVPKLAWGANVLEDAYTRCAEVTSEYAKTFYLGTQLMTPRQAKAIWAIYVWCRRTDELVDGPNASQITPEVRAWTACSIGPFWLNWVHGFMVTLDLPLCMATA